MAKSRVAPLKPVTIPRLELTAALVSVKTSTILQRELEYDKIAEVFWTDSKVVIVYISNDARRFHVFVANRVQQIRDRTSPSQWKYVESQINPADDASRGQNAQDLIENSRWWNGPEFLWRPLEDQGLLDDVVYISPDDPEVRKISTMATQTQECFTLPDRLKYFSSWYRAKCAIAVCLRFQRSFQTGSKEEIQVKTEEVCTSVPKTTHSAHSAKSKQSKMNQYVPVNTQELQNAEMEILKAVQREAFKEEISLLCSADAQGSQDRNTFRSMKKSSTLYRLDPFLDKNGVL